VIIGYLFFYVVSYVFPESLQAIVFCRKKYSPGFVKPGLFKITD
jgi:hypothetical protein